VFYSHGNDLAQNISNICNKSSVLVLNSILYNIKVILLKCKT